tara:strand:+ start:168 stop:968 length:801 start_codon:yes stop_codon:yes gene_type:complete
VKTVSLVFDYNLEKQKKSGRFWSESGYKNKDFIFEYSAASFASFLHMNPERVHIVDTDDVDFLFSKMKKYNVNLENLDIRDSKDLISEWSSEEYCFWPLLYHLKHHAESSKDSVVKLDNDLTCLKPIDELKSFKGALAWKFERNVKDGRQYWGESFVCREALGTDDFLEYNTGVLGISKNNLYIVNDFIETTKKMLNIDASHIIRFPDDPSRRVKNYATSDQTSVNWVFNKYNINVRETHDYFFHHCYAIDAKENCIKDSKYLLRK